MNYIKSKNPLFTETDIIRKTRDVALDLIAWKDENEIPRKLVFCIILKGGFKFASEIMRNWDVWGYPYDLTFISAKSYYDQTSPEEDNLKISFLDNITEFKDQTFILIDDILDTGNTMNEIKLVMSNYTNRIKTCVLVDKPINRKHDIEPDFYGFRIEENHFLVGYGMGLGENYRSDPFISIMEEEKL